MREDGKESFGIGRTHRDPDIVSGVFQQRTAIVTVIENQSALPVDTLIVV
jgi:hypothetical protein